MALGAAAVAAAVAAALTSPQRVHLEAIEQQLKHLPFRTQVESPGVETTDSPGQPPGAPRGPSQEAHYLHLANGQGELHHRWLERKLIVPVTERASCIRKKLHFS